MEALKPISKEAVVLVRISKIYQHGTKNCPVLFAGSRILAVSEAICPEGW